MNSIRLRHLLHYKSKHPNSGSLPKTSCRSPSWKPYILNVSGACDTGNAGNVWTKDNLLRTAPIHFTALRNCSLQTKSFATLPEGSDFCCCSCSSAAATLTVLSLVVRKPSLASFVATKVSFCWRGFASSTNSAQVFLDRYCRKLR